MAKPSEKERSPAGGALDHRSLTLYCSPAVGEGRGESRYLHSSWQGEL